MAGEMTWFAPTDLERFAAQVFGAASTPEDLAALAAQHLIAANLAGHDSHGVLRVPSYVELIDRGQLDPAARPTTLRETSSTAVLDGAHGFGYTTMETACQLGAAKAREHGLSAVAIRNCGHIGRVGGWVEALAQDGLIARLTVGSLAPDAGAAAPFGGAARTLGTNPWAIGIPAADDAPVVLDFATTAVAEGKLRVARAKRAALPPGWIVGPDGAPSTDVEDFYRGGMLLPFGGHKGYALSVVAALLGALAADGAEDGRAAGVFLAVIDPAAFGDPAAYARRVAAAASTLRRARPAAGGGPVLAPGDPERASRWLRAEAVPLAAGTLEQFEAIAGRFGIAMPQRLTTHRRLGAYLAEEYGVPAARLRDGVARQEASAAAERPRLGDLLLTMGAVDAANLEGALQRQRADDAQGER